MEKVFLLIGFKKIRQKGSHAFYKHDDGRTTTIPHHSSRMLARPLIRKIIRDIELSIEEYNNLLKKI